MSWTGDKEPTMRAKTAMNATNEVRMMQVSTAVAMRRRLKGAAWGGEVGIEVCVGLRRVVLSVQREMAGVILGGGGVGVEDDGGPLSIRRRIGGNGGYLGGFDLEDAELGGVVLGVDLVAEGTFCDARTCAAGGDELAGEFDEVCGNLLRGVGGLEAGRVAEGDLVVEGEVFVVEGIGGGEGIGVGE